MTRYATEIDMETDPKCLTAAANYEFEAGLLACLCL